MIEIKLYVEVSFEAKEINSKAVTGTVTNIQNEKKSRYDLRNISKIDKK